jgi:hypothetical protein
MRVTGIEPGAIYVLILYVATNILRAGLKPSSETSFILNIALIMDNVKYNMYI